jgi:hypothetical protein
LCNAKLIPFFQEFRMSSIPDQNAAMQAMFQAGTAMAQGFSRFLAEQQEKAAATPGGLNRLPHGLPSLKR